MKLKPLHPKNKFLSFLSLSLLVIGGSVGVILATQKQVFDEPKAGEQCTSTDACNQAIENNSICISNNVYTCTRRFSRYTYRLTEKCPSGYKCTTINNNRSCLADCVIDHSNDCNIDGITRCNDGWVERCTDGEYKGYQYCPSTGKDCMYLDDRAWCEKLPEETKRTPKPTSKSTPKPTTGPCSYSCVAAVECTAENGGTIKQGYCSSGLKCCEW